MTIKMVLTLKNPLVVPRNTVPRKIKIDDLKELAYEISYLPGKGQCMIARRDMRAGEVIVTEKPLINMPDSVYSYEDMRDIETWLDRHMNRFSSEERIAFFDLADCRTPALTDGKEEKSALGIFFTNDMNFDGDAAVFPIISRANHSCVPNADFVTRGERRVQEIIATSNIAAGEEITLSYLHAASEGSEGKKERQGYTRLWYGFQCRCGACSLDGQELILDEAARTRVREIQGLLADSSTAQHQVALVPLPYLDAFLDDLRIIGSKLSYRLEMTRFVFDRAVTAGDAGLLAKTAAAGYMLDDIVNGCEAGSGNEFEFGIRSTLVFDSNDSEAEGYLYMPGGGLAHNVTTL